VHHELDLRLAVQMVTALAGVIGNVGGKLAGERGTERTEVLGILR